MRMKKLLLPLAAHFAAAACLAAGEPQVAVLDWTNSLTIVDYDTGNEVVLDHARIVDSKVNGAVPDHDTEYDGCQMELVARFDRDVGAGDVTFYGQVRSDNSAWGLINSATGEQKNNCWHPLAIPATPVGKEVPLMSLMLNSDGGDYAVYYNSGIGGSLDLVLGALLKKYEFNFTKLIETFYCGIVFHSDDYLGTTVTIDGVVMDPRKAGEDTWFFEGRSASSALHRWFESNEWRDRMTGVTTVLEYANGTWTLYQTGINPGGYGTFHNVLGTVSAPENATRLAFAYGTPPLTLVRSKGAYVKVCSFTYRHDRGLYPESGSDPGQWFNTRMGWYKELPRALALCRNCAVTNAEDALSLKGRGRVVVDGAMHTVALSPAQGCERYPASSKRMTAVVEAGSFGCPPFDAIRAQYERDAGYDQTAAMAPYAEDGVTNLAGLVQVGATNCFVRLSPVRQVDWGGDLTCVVTVKRRPSRLGVRPKYATTASYEVNGVLFSYGGRTDIPVVEYPIEDSFTVVGSATLIECYGDMEKLPVGHVVGVE